MNRILEFPKNALQKYRNSSPVFKATVWFMLCSIIQKAISLITVPFFTRMLSQEQYGQYAVYNSWQTIFTMICTLRLEYSVFDNHINAGTDQCDRMHYDGSLSYLSSAGQ